jgi:hypothetical protein
MSDTDTMELPEAKVSTGFLITLKASTPEGEALVAEWNATFPQPYSNEMVEVPDEFYGFSDNPPRLTYPGLLLQLSDEAYTLFYFGDELDDTPEFQDYLNIINDAVGTATSECDIDEGEPYINIELFATEQERDEALKQLQSLPCMAGSQPAPGEIELAESPAPIGPMTA